MTLSDERHDLRLINKIVYFEEDVKRFIKKQGEDIISRLFRDFGMPPTQLELVEKATKISNEELAGDKLIDNKQGADE